MNEKKHRPPLGQFMVDRRNAIGKKANQAAADAGIKPAYWSQIENGSVKLPGAALRRQIARALHVPHVRILVAAGELTAEEAGLQDAPSNDAVQSALETIATELRKVAYNPRNVDEVVNDVRTSVAFVLAVSPPPGTEAGRSPTESSPPPVAPAPPSDQ